MRFRDKVALVTGGAKGMGGPIAEALAREGASLVLAARDLGRLERGIETIRRAVPKVRALAVKADVAEEPQIVEMVERAIKEFGRIDILTNAAGGVGPVDTPLHEIKVEEWDTVFSVKVRGTFLCCKHVVPHMIKQRYGRIVNFSGTAGLAGYVNRGSYSAAQWALRGLTRTLALEVGRYNITVNAICPGLIEGDRIQGVREEKAQRWGWTPEQVRQKDVDETVMGRLGEPEDIVEAVLFLASDAAKNMTGQDLVVDAGWSVSPCKREGLKR
ncbi:MAG: SDR family NAD(P)-dependent oxidoreductase [Candidatus Rokuibacteriota bacterium]